MKIGIYDPYLDTLGGGEKYILDIATLLSKKHHVDIFWDTSQQQAITNQAKKQFGVDLGNINFVKNIFTPEMSFIKRFFISRQYDVILFVSDGSIPLLGAKKNILLLQFSVNWVKKGIKEHIKFHFIHNVICYSEFVKAYIDKTFGISSIVIPPTINSLSSSKQKKGNVILTVGRFTKGMNTKKQEFQIDAFKRLYDNGVTDWEFILIGSHLPQDSNFVTMLEEKAKGYPIHVIANASLETLITYYQRAKIYWHAAGFGEDLSKYPERAEHFGITTVEAMSAGAVPVVFKGGGQKEIVTDHTDGFSWDTEEELLEKTKLLIEDDAQWKKYSLHAIKTAEKYSEKVFQEKIESLIK